jgi:UDP-glucose 4-epimerase
VKGDLAIGEQNSEAAPGSGASTIPDEAMLEPRKIAEIFEIPYENLRKRLERRRKHDLNCCVENENHTSTEASYLYRIGSIRSIIEDLRTSSKRPAQKKSR